MPSWLIPHVEFDRREFAVKPGKLVPAPPLLARANDRIFSWGGRGERILSLGKEVVSIPQGVMLGLGSNTRHWLCSLPACSLSAPHRALKLIRGVDGVKERGCWLARRASEEVTLS